MEESDLDEDKDFVLVENTAQTVFKYLDHLRDRKPSLGTRWIWELLQNARDAASPDGVAVEVAATPTHLRFKHTGRPFRNREIAHLIYHGSTKGKDEGDLGRFGSGFLSTHLLSLVVHARGILHSGKQFDFSIDRSGQNVDDLRESMNASWLAFKTSLEPAKPNSQFTTEFEYPLADEAVQLVAAGLQQLKTCAPLVLAFAEKLTEFQITTVDESWNMKRGTKVQTGRAHILSVACEDKNGAKRRYVATVEREKGAAAALLLEDSGESKQLAMDRLIPRLYIAFPLVSTERMMLPAAISDLRFKPHEDRDGLVLDSTTDGGKENMPLVERLGSSIDALIASIADERWRGSERLAAFDQALLPEWAKHEWFLAFARKRLEFVRNTALLETRGGSWIAPTTAWIPLAQGDGAPAKLGALLNSWEGSGERMPPDGTLTVWSSNLLNWAALLQVDPHTLPEAMTIPRLARLAAETATLGALKKKIPEDESALEWLVELVGLVQAGGHIRLFEELSLLPAQSSNLKRLGGLWCDSGIDDGLKDIADRLGFNLRDTLLNPEAATKEIVGLLKQKTEDQALGEVISALKEICKVGRMPNSRIAANADLIAWIARRKKYSNRLATLPVATCDSDDESSAVLELSKVANPEDRPLAPVMAWPEKLREFSILFARRKTLHSTLGESRLADIWAGLDAEAFVHRSPVYVSKMRMTRFLPSEPLPELGTGKRHESEDELEVSNIALIEAKNIGAVDLARSGRARATKLVEMLIELARNSDARSFETMEVKCQSCQKTHAIYRAAWLIPVRDRKWVPVDADDQRHDWVSAASLAALLKDSQALVAALSDDPGSQLLKALGVSPADFALRVIADSEQAQISLIHSMADLAQAAGGDVGRLREFANEIREHPGIIKQIEQQREDRNQIKKNQQIGKLVEELLEAELEDQKGVKFERRTVGADFEIESDYTEEGREVLLEVGFGESSTFIELKATKTDYAKMTPRQAEKSCELESRFALCVVPVGPEQPTREWVKENARFVFGIGTQIAPVLAQLDSIVQATASARRIQGPVEIDMTEGQYRFRVHRTIWGQGQTFSEAISRIRAAARPASRP